MDERIIVFADKTVLKIEGVRVEGLRPNTLEQRLTELLQTPVRVIGVTGESIQMDIYGLSPEAVRKDKEGLIRAVATTEGIEPRDVIRIANAGKAIPVDINQIPPRGDGCAGERWKRQNAAE